MPDEAKVLKSIEKKLDKLFEEVAEISKSLEILLSIPTIIEKIDEIESELKESTSSEIEVFEKKMDDLQQYVAGLSVLDERIQELSESFTETNEIVGIIVRQLDDLERKYNKALEEITNAVKTIHDYVESETSSASSENQTKKSAKKKKKEEPSEPEEEIPPSTEIMPETIDGLMDHLRKLVNPQTEAREMASMLERVRDQIPPLIEGHTPVLFQFGKLARELKSYPPTATLNENDIARLNKDLSSWKTKLKEIAKNE